MKKYISPSLLNVEDVKRPEMAQTLINNGIEWIHYDVMDGIFVPNKAITIENYEFIQKNTSEHISDIHLMVDDAQEYIEKYLGKATYITFHYEVLDFSQIKKLVKKYNGLAKIGIAIKPDTNIEQIYGLLDDIDLVLIMSVEPGKGEQSFIPNSLNKIKSLKKYCGLHNKNIIIQVDGGINNIIAPQAFKAGADVLVSGSYLVKHPTKEQIKTLLK